MEKKVINIETAPGKFVPTMVNSIDNPQYFCEATECPQINEEVKVEEIPVVEEKPKKKAGRPKKSN